ncbi:MAG: A24 family peptidase [Peptococcaceae bacterium]|nr:A24 family peptidase [Peptococcaceae bacterium]MDH7524799.1 A24 family peptidase [Peptococcaceae bacterium]
MPVIDVTLLVVLLISCYTDLRFQKIYNALLFPPLLGALVLHCLSGGMGGLFFSLKGLALGMALLFPPYLLGGMGAGDVKLLGLVGALKGAQFVFASFLLAALLGGVMSLLVLACRGQLARGLKKTGQGLKTAFFSRFTVWNFASLEEENADSFPYGLAIAAGALAALMVA